MQKDSKQAKQWCKWQLKQLSVVSDINLGDPSRRCDQTQDSPAVRNPVHCRWDNKGLIYQLLKFDLYLYGHTTMTPFQMVTTSDKMCSIVVQSGDLTCLIPSYPFMYATINSLTLLFHTDIYYCSLTARVSCSTSFWGACRHSEQWNSWKIVMQINHKKGICGKCTWIYTYIIIICNDNCTWSMPIILR